MTTQEKQREHYKKLVTMRYLGHQDYLGGYYEAPTKEDFIEGIVDIIESAKREAWIKSRIDTLQEFAGNSDGISVRSGDGYADVQTEIGRLQAQLKQSEESI